MNFESLAKALLEARGTAKVADLSRVRQNTQSNILYTSLMTLSNFHLMISQIYDSNGNQGRSTYHNNLANQFRSEANANRRKADN